MRRLLEREPATFVEKAVGAREGKLEVAEGFDEAVLH